MARLEIKDVYIRKPNYGGIHVVVNTNEFFSIGDRFALRRNGVVVGYFYVKKVSIDGNDLVMQLVDNGDSAAYRDKMDIRNLVRGEVEYSPYVPPVRDGMEEDNAAYDRDEDDTETNGDELEEGLPD